MENYVLLTGGKNNAGDFLIKHRAKKLFSHLRPDRGIIDFDAWKPLTDEQLEVINKSKALILTGGPALQYDMYPRIYAIPELDNIKVPITTLGIGWKSMNGEWKDTYQYPLSDSTLKLLKRIQNDGLAASVRDYHTLKVLQNHGFDNFLMTGCPAYYELAYIHKPVDIPKEINKIAYSLGVAFIDSPKMETSTKNDILKLKDYFKDENFEVVFHHSLDKSKITSVYSQSHKRYIARHLEFAQWLDTNNIKYVDISGSAENLINYYSQVDLHIGYRVHAHIFMNSISKLSILIAEDGRGKATYNVINGIVIKAFDDFVQAFTFFEKVLIKLKLKNPDRFNHNKYILQEIKETLDYQKNVDYHFLKNSRNIIDQNFTIMQQFLSQLP